MVLVPASFVLLFVALSSVAARGQCPTVWSSGGPQPQLSGTAVCSTQWDADGAGPLPVRLVVGGLNLVAGNAAVDARVMSWDGSEWAAVGGTGPGTGVNGQVTSLVEWNGSLVAGGHFTGGGADHVAIWTGSAWQGLGTGFPFAPAALAVWNGQLVAVGQTGGVPTIRTWNGVSWSVLPAPPSLMFPRQAISYQGLLCVCGGENSPTQGVLERWNGTSWLPSIFAQHTINALAVRTPQVVGPELLYAGGRFTSIGGVAAARVAVTSGGAAFAWSAIGTGLTEECTDLHVRNSGLTGFTVVGSFVSATAPTKQFTSGGSWTAMGSEALTSLQRFAGSYHGTHATTHDDSLRRWDGTAWVTVQGPGLVGSIRAATRSGADVIVGGTFATASGTSLHGVARWDGTTFHPLAAGLIGTTPTTVEALVTLANGDVVAGGSFFNAGGVGAQGIARWNGAAWSNVGLGIYGTVLALAQLPNGDLVAGGSFFLASGVPCSRIARWNGTSWSPFGIGMNGDVHALAVRSDGTLFAAGAFTTAGGSACNHIAQWNGTDWIQVGQGMNGDVHALAVRPNDDVVAVGAFTSAGGLPAARCARWTGVAWAAMDAASGDATPPRAVVALPNGDVVAGRGFHQPVTSPDVGISRWDGTSWTALGGGLGAHYATIPVSVRALVLRADGRLVVGGDFAVAGGSLATGGGVVAHDLATFASTCMPLASSAGAPCGSPGGGVVLTADTLPWIGATFHTTTTGITSGSVCLGVIGLTAIAVPLDAIFAEAVPGCQLYATPDILLLLASGPGTAHSQFALADDPSLLSVTFFQQTIPLEFDALGALAVVRGSNRLVATIGTL